MKFMNTDEEGGEKLLSSVKVGPAELSVLTGRKDRVGRTTHYGEEDKLGR